MSFQDKIGAADSTSVDLNANLPPKDPCPKCSKALKEHHDNQMICSNRLCRFVVRLDTTGKTAQ